MEKFGKTVGVYFVDPDVVEHKNCYRQNFCEAEIGRNKAESMAFRYGLAWGIEISAYKPLYPYLLFLRLSRLYPYLPA